jgi:hypothetical protein
MIPPKTREFDPRRRYAHCYPPGALLSLCFKRRRADAQHAPPDMPRCPLCNGLAHAYPTPRARRN